MWQKINFFYSFVLLYLISRGLWEANGYIFVTISFSFISTLFLFSFSLCKWLWILSALNQNFNKIKNQNLHNTSTPLTQRRKPQQQQNWYVIYDTELNKKRMHIQVKCCLQYSKKKKKTKFNKMKENGKPFHLI